VSTTSKYSFLNIYQFYLKLNIFILSYITIAHSTNITILLHKHYTSNVILHIIKIK